MPPGSLDKECLFSLMESPLDLDCAEKAFSCRRVSFVPHPARTHPHHARTQVEQLYTRVFRPALAFPRPRKIAASSAPRSGPGRRKHGGRGSASSQEPGPHQPAPHPLPVHLPATPPRDRSIGSLPHSLTHSLPSLPPAPSLPFCLPSSRSPAARGAPKGAARLSASFASDTRRLPELSDLRMRKVSGYLRLSPVISVYLRLSPASTGHRTGSIYSPDGYRPRYPRLM